jgi:hypothetical protein
MRRFLVCSGVYGQAEALDRLDALLHQRRPEGLLFAGGVLSRPRECTPTSTTEFGYTKEEAAFVERFFATLGRSGVFSAVVPGVFDAPLDQFLRLGMAAELEYPRLHLVHATPVVEGDVAVFGLGACIDGYTDTDIGYYSRTLAEYYFRPLWTVRQPRTVLLLAEPPESWHGDAENRRLADALIATYHPRVCIFGNPRERQGVERLASTLVINPGALADRRAAWLDWDRHAEHQVEFLDLGATAAESNEQSRSRAGVTEVSAVVGKPA